MTKSELEIALGQKVEGLTKVQIKNIIDAFFSSLIEGIHKDGRFSYGGFGTFSIGERGPRAGRNPRTGDPINISATKVVKFKPSPKFKNVINEVKEVKEEVKAVEKKAAKKAAPKAKKGKK